MKIIRQSKGQKEKVVRVEDLFLKYFFDRIAEKHINKLDRKDY